MVRAVIATEEECKEVLIARHIAQHQTRPRTDSLIATQNDDAGMNRKPAMLKTFLHKHMSMLMTHVQDGRLRAHPLVLVEPATLRASTLMSFHSKPSVMRPNERCPLAASPRSGTGGWSGGGQWNL